jgi:hypothetical protein
MTNSHIKPLVQFLCWRETTYFMQSFKPVGEFKSSTLWAENLYTAYLKPPEHNFCSSKYHRKTFIPQWNALINKFELKKTLLFQGNSLNFS